MRVDHLTDNPEVRKAWECPDAELKTMIEILPQIPLEVRSDYQKCISLHGEYIESGLVVVPWAYQEILQSLDPYLRLRWDILCDPPCYVIERIDTSLRAWIRLYRWADKGTGEPKNLSDSACREIVQYLQERDMRQYDSPQKYLEMKRAKAARRQKELWDRGSGELMDVIDRMPRRAVREFVAAEKAIAAGERIHPTGQDAKTLNDWYEIGRRSDGSDGPLLPQSSAINPGHAPVRR